MVLMVLYVLTLLLILLTATEAFGQTDLELQSRLMSHQFNFQSAFDTRLYWRHIDQPHDGQALGGVYPMVPQGAIETMFNVVPGNLYEKL